MFLLSNESTFAESFRTIRKPKKSDSSAGGHFKLVATSHYQESPDVAVPSFYIFNVGEGQGYVIAAADGRTFVHCTRRINGDTHPHE